MKHGSETTRVINSGGSVAVLGGNVHRCGFLVFGAVNGFTVMSTDPAAGLNGPIRINYLNSQPVYISREMVGDLIERPWFAINDTGSYPISLIEVVE